MFSRKACAISGIESKKISRLKNASLTAGQPGEVTTSAMRIAANTSVLASAIQTLLCPPPEPFRSARILEPRPGSAPALTR